MWLAEEPEENLDKKWLFSKFFGKVGIIFWLLFNLIWKKFHSILRFLTQKVALWIFLLVFLLMKRHNKIFFLSNFQCRKWIFVELVNRAKICHKNQSVTNFIKAGKNLLFKNALMPSIFFLNKVFKLKRSFAGVVKNDFVVLTNNWSSSERLQIFPCF